MNTANHTKQQTKDKKKKKKKKNEEKYTRRPGDGIRWNNYSLLYDELIPIYFNIVRIIAYGWWWMDIKTDRCVAKAYKIQPSASIYTYKIPKNILVNIGIYIYYSYIRNTNRANYSAMMVHIFRMQISEKMKKWKIGYIMQKVHVLPRPSLILLLIFIEIADALAFFFYFFLEWSRFGRHLWLNGLRVI